MRVCILNELFHAGIGGGKARFVVDLATKLSAIDHVEVCAVASTNCYRSPVYRCGRFELLAGVEVHRVDYPVSPEAGVSRRLVGDLLFARRVSNKLASLKPCDVVLVTSAPSTLALAAQRYLRNNQAPYVYFVFDIEPDLSVALGQVDEGAVAVTNLRRRQARWLKEAHAIVTPGQCVKSSLIDRYNIPTDRIHVIGTGADERAIRPKKGSTRFREVTGIKGFMVLYAGYIGGANDLEVVLDAAMMIWVHDPEITIAIVGRGELRRELELRVIREQIVNVRFFDQHEDLADLLASADVCLLPMKPGAEGLCLPSKLFSSLAAGRPIIAATGSPSEVAAIVDREDVGVVVQPRDPEALAKAILRLALQPERLAAQGSRARALAVSRFGINDITARIHSLLSMAVT